jgi:ligand-binding sensor domain-containing protein
MRTVHLIVLLVSFGVGSVSGQTNFWQRMSTSLTSRILSLALSPRGYLFAGTEDQRVVRSSDDGLTWVNVGDPQLSRAIWSLAVDSAGTVFAGTDFRGIFRSTNDGATWDSSGLASQRIACLLLTQDGVAFAGVWDAGIYRSTDGGVTWNLVGAPEEKVRSMIETSSGAIIATTDTIHQGGRMYRSVDGGERWTRIGFGLSSLVVHALVSMSPESLFAGTDGQGVYMSTDTGDSWARSSPPFPTTVNTLLRVPGEGIFAGLTSSGIYRTTDDELTWFSENSGLINLEIHSLVHGNDGRVYGGTGEGIYRSAQILSAALDEAGSPQFPNLFLGAHPNPFNGETVLNYRVPEPGPVRLSVFDLLGRETLVLDDIPRRAGQYSVRWVADNHASGVYVAVLEASGQRVSRKMLLLK